MSSVKNYVTPSRIFLNMTVCLEDILQLAVLIVVNLDPYLKIIEDGDAPDVTCVDQSGHVISSVPSIVKAARKGVSGRIECPFKLNGNRVINKNREIIWCIKLVSKKEHSHKVAESPYSYAKLRRIEDEESHQRIVAMIESSVSNVAIANTMNSSGLVVLPKDIANIKQKLRFADDVERPTTPLRVSKNQAYVSSLSLVTYANPV
ncbi:hypothetical protein BDB01DRAFT_845840 [Pilobolus umbonatus]|nr:hypothetical protein BDB01DRAFT_845840 [Pilobolus umbonatus]